MDHATHSDLTSNTSILIFPYTLPGEKMHESFPNAYAGMSQGSSGLKGGGKGWWKSTSLMCEPVYFFLFFVLMWTILQAFFEFVRILLLLYVLVFGHEACGIFAP